MNLLCIDPSTTCLGWAYQVGDSKPSHGILKQHQRDGAKVTVFSQLPDLPWDNATHLYFEEPLANSIHGNVRTVAALHRLAGQLEGHADARFISNFRVPPAVWRKVCGIKGKDRAAKKRAAIVFVKRLYGITAQEDEAEALCLLHYAQSTWKTMEE